MRRISASVPLICDQKAYCERWRGSVLQSIDSPAWMKPLLSERYRRGKIESSVTEISVSLMKRAMSPARHAPCGLSWTNMKKPPGGPTHISPLSSIKAVKAFPPQNSRNCRNRIYRMFQNVSGYHTGILI